MNGCTHSSWRVNAHIVCTVCSRQAPALLWPTVCTISMRARISCQTATMVPQPFSFFPIRGHHDCDQWGGGGGFIGRHPYRAAVLLITDPKGRSARPVCVPVCLWACHIVYRFGPAEMNLSLLKNIISWRRAGRVLWPRTTTLAYQKLYQDGCVFVAILGMMGPSMRTLALGAQSVNNVRWAVLQEHGSFCYCHHRLRICICTVCVQYIRHITPTLVHISR